MEEFVSAFSNKSCGFSDMQKCTRNGFSFINRFCIHLKSEQSGGKKWSLIICSNDARRRLWVESKKLWRIMRPIIFTRVAMFGTTIITLAFMGHLGDLQLAAISIAITMVVGFNFGFLVSSYNLFLNIYLVKLPLPQLSTISTENILKIFFIELFEVIEDLGCI